MSNLHKLKLDFQLVLIINSVILLLFVSVLSQGQDIIRLENPSLEDTPRCCQAPKGWKSLDFYGNTPPDIQPGGGFKVNTPPNDGKTYVAMVTRDDGTFETIYQKLSTPLQPNQCYVFSVFLAVSREYVSGTKYSPNELISFSSPVVLQVLGGNDPKDPELEILNASTPVDHFDWIEYVFEFIPGEDFKYLFLSAYFPEGIEYFINGHILIDNLSDIVPCEEGEE